MAVGAPLVGRLLDRFGSRLVVVVGTLVLAVGLLGIGVVPLTLTTFIAAALVTGLGLSSLLGAPVRYIILNESGEEDRGAAQGVKTVFSNFGQLFGGALVGAIAASHGGTASGYKLAYLLLGIMTVVVAGLSLGLKRQQAEQESAATS